MRTLERNRTTICILLILFIFFLLCILCSLAQHKCNKWLNSNFIFKQNFLFIFNFSFFCFFIRISVLFVHFLKKMFITFSFVCVLVQSIFQFTINFSIRTICTQPNAECEHYWMLMLSRLNSLNSSSDNMLLETHNNNKTISIFNCMYTERFGIG